MEGEIVLEYSEPQIGGGNVIDHDPDLKVDGQLLDRGHISLQAESHPTDFRSIRLLNLEGCTDPDASNYKSYYLKSDPDLCIYCCHSEAINPGSSPSNVSFHLTARISPGCPVLLRPTNTPSSLIL